MSAQNLPSVSIIGCGWLGKPLAATLNQHGVSVIATTQSSDKFADIETTGAKAALLSLPLLSANLDSAQENVQQEVFNQQCMIICLPPQIKHGKKDYPDKIKQLVTYAEQQTVEKIILISSTAVYGGLSGDVAEDTPLDYNAAKVAILAEAEQAALAFKGQSVVLRLAGLVGPNRHPGRFLTANRQLANSEVAINLIHLDDVIGLLLSLIKSDAPTGIFNGVNDIHLSKQNFYQQAAKALSLPLPSFSQANTPLPSKVVLGAKAKTQLNYKMKHDDLLAWVTLGEQ